MDQTTITFTDIDKIIEASRLIPNEGVGVWQIDESNKTIYIDAVVAKWLGYKSADIVGTPLEDLMDEEARKIFPLNVERRRLGLAEVHDFRFQQKNGEEVWLLLRTTPVFDRKGDYRGAFALCTNLQESRKLERDLEERKQFTQIASHELRNPITILRLQLELLLRKTTGANRDNLSTALKQVERINRLVGDLLDTSRIEAGKMRFVMEPVDLVHTLREIQVLPSEKCPVELHVPDEPVFVNCDALRITQVVQNLITNAQKYACDGPIDVDLNTKEGKVCISVTDHGKGIPKEQLGHIFERFAQVDRIKKDGLGLGLFISRAIVEGHGGKISVESKEDGSKFTFCLPK